MSNDQLQATLKTFLETQIIQALNSAPEALEKMVRAALSDPVDSRSGTRDGYHGSKVPFLEYMVGDEIRSATRAAAHKIIQEMMPNIEAEVRKGLSSESVVAAVTKSLVGAAGQEWRINVAFEAVKDR